MQIVTGNKFKKAVKCLKLTGAKQLYLNSKYDFEIWDLDEEEYNRLRKDRKFRWRSNYGWWVYTDYCKEDLISKTKTFFINGNIVDLAWNPVNMLNYIDDHRLESMILIEDQNDYWPIISEDEVTKIEKQYYWDSHCSYSNFSEFCKTIWDYTDPQNVGRFLLANAQKNSMTPLEFAKLVY